MPLKRHVYDEIQGNIYKKSKCSMITFASDLSSWPVSASDDVGDAEPITGLAVAIAAASSVATRGSL